MTLSVETLAEVIYRNARECGVGTINLDDADHVATAILTAIEQAGHVVVPREATREMQNAAIDVDSRKLGDISPLGFRASPQMLFARCYEAMLSAAPKIQHSEGE